ncbi:hypothetical protein EB796_012795 [Bugula neritina]|uniref:Uncharacterized protein n=1 Tax=Bugula neritina TaxID=10212 RepID=A0A7J7JSI7_BUGNE|nr:hypothetical protein EB796_012795 [Bugula neritina]
MLGQSTCQPLLVVCCNKKPKYLLSGLDFCDSKVTFIHENSGCCDIKFHIFSYVGIFEFYMHTTVLYIEQIRLG